MTNEWTDGDSKQFLDFADVITPDRREQMQMLTSLIPAGRGDAFEVVELGCGGGELAAIIVERFPFARYLGLDGSPMMLERASAHTKLYPDRTRFHLFNLHETDWQNQLTRPVRVFVSSLVVHHLNDAEKHQLYQDLYKHLEPGGALLLIDIVMPTYEGAKAAIAAQWNAIVQQQSLERTGSLDVYEEFQHGGWNCYTHPDPMDMPTSLFKQLRWLADIGFTNVDCFWQRAGHAVFGGYRP